VFGGVEREERGATNLLSAKDRHDACVYKPKKPKNPRRKQKKKPRDVKILRKRWGTLGG